jgi:tetratricopeptide (TPR) repeat protein
MTMPLAAQGFEPGDDPMLEQDGPGMPGQRPGMPGHEMHPGMRPGMRPQRGPGGDRQGMRKGPPDPEKIKEMQRRSSVMAMAEAHKNLSQIYEQQGKIDEAAAELKNILTLISSEKGSDQENPNESRMLTSKLIPVYHEIARLYLQNNRQADAEKIINEGATRFAETDPAAASRLLLHLSEIYRGSDDLDKAAKNYQRIIEMNKKVLEQK